jgi:hypothetical protein
VADLSFDFALAPPTLPTPSAPAVVAIGNPGVVGTTGKSTRSTRGWSYYSCFLECPRKFAYENRSHYPDVPGERPPGNNVPAVGTFAHALLAMLYLWRMDRSNPDPVKMKPGEISLLAHESGLTRPDMLDWASDVYQRFKLYAAEFANESWVPFTVEEEFKIGILAGPDGVPRVVDAGTPGSALFTSRLDLGITDHRGRWIVDHKTTQKYWRTTAVNYGMTGQMHGMEHIGRHHWPDDFQGVLLNFFQTKDSVVFKRERPAAAPRMVEDFPRTIWMTAGMIGLWDKVAQTARDWTPKSGYWCKRCDFAQECRFGV